MISQPAWTDATTRSWPRRILSWGGDAALLGLAAAVLVLAGKALYLGVGSGYYALPFDARPDHALHTSLRPGGGLGLRLGVAGTALMVLMHAYSLRKALPLRWPLGSPAWWLRFHILCGVGGPLLIVLHVGFAWPAGLVAVAFWCMLLVSASGAFGRYIYGRFPRSAAGVELSLTSAASRIRDLRAEIVAATENADAQKLAEAVALASDLAPARSLLGLIAVDGAVRRRARQIRRLLASAGLDKTGEGRAAAALLHQLRLKRALSTRVVSARLFRYWHLFHEPLARAMYLIVAWHVFTAVVFGGAIEALFSEAR